MDAPRSEVGFRGVGRVCVYAWEGKATSLMGYLEMPLALKFSIFRMYCVGISPLL